MAERDIQWAIRVALGKDPRVVLWRNNTGTAERDGARIRYGLCVGSSDLIGILRTTGRFIALEVKTNKGRVSEEQTQFLDLVRSCGGFACIVRSVDEACQAVDRACGGASE
jgi:hypothetical protein